MNRWSWRVAPLTLLVSALAAAFACQSSGSGDVSCDPVCAGVADCAGTSCLAYCITLRTTCSATGLDSAFSAWASCGPELACADGVFVPRTCTAQAVATIACGAAMETGPGTVSSNGSTSGPVVVSSNSGNGTGSVSRTSSGTATSGSGTGFSTGSGGTGGSDAGVCTPIGQTCSEGTACCSLYCKAGVCACNTSGYACGQATDCCEGYVCSNAICVGNASTVVRCQDCAADAGACTGTRRCTDAPNGGTFCAQDCTSNPESCPLDMTCTPDGTGTSSCIPNSGSCVVADAG